MAFQGKGIGMLDGEKKAKMYAYLVKICYIEPHHC